MFAGASQPSGHATKKGVSWDPLRARPNIGATQRR
jgi:hypothetical protein